MVKTLGYRTDKRISPEYIKEMVEGYLREYPDVMDLQVIVDWLGDSISINCSDVNGYHYNFCTIVYVQKNSGDTVKDVYVRIMEGICQQVSL